MISRSWPFNAKGQRIFVLASTSEGLSLSSRERWVYVARNESALSPVTPGPASSLKRWRCTSFYPPFAPSPPLANPYRISQIYLSHLFQTRVPFFRTAVLSRSDYSIFRRSREEACCVWSPCDIFLLYFVLYFLGGRGYEFTRERNFRNSLPSIFSRVEWRIQGSVFFFSRENFLLSMFTN